MKKLILTITCAIALSANVMAQECTTLDYAISLMDEGMDQSCYECLKKLLDQDDQNGEAYFVLGQLYHKVGDYATALEMYEKAEYYKVYENNKKLLADAYLFHSLCYKEMGLHDKEGEYLHKAAKTDNNNILSHLYLATFYLDRDLNEAEKSANKSLKLATNEEDRAQAYGLKSSIALKNKRYADAISFAEKSIGENPESQYGYARLAEAYKESGQYDKAADNAIECIKHYQQRDEDINLAESILFEYANIDYDKAYAKILEKAPRGNIGWIHIRVQIAKEAKRYEEALSIIDNELGIDNDVNECEEYYYIEALLGDFVNAARHCEQAYNLDSRNLNHLFNQFLYLESAGDEDAFYKVINQAIEDWPNRSFLYYRKGFHQYNRRQYAEAIENLKTAYELDNDYIWTILPLAQSYMKMGNKTEADKWFKRIIESDPNNFGSKECIAFAYYYLGDNDKAVETINDDEYSKACLYSLMGNKKLALEHLRKSLEDGYVDFEHIAHDAAFDNIKDEKEFHSLINQYETKRNNRISSKNIRP